MLPKPLTTSPNPSIHINPKFRNVHINPSFLSKLGGNRKPTSEFGPTQIYINPRFLSRSTQSMAITNSIVPLPVHTNQAANRDAMYDDCDRVLSQEPLADTKIHSRTKIINDSKNVKLQSKIVDASNLYNILKPAVLKPLIRIGSKKLIRIGSQTSAKPQSNAIKSSPKLRRPLQTKYKIVKEQTAFKIDRRSLKAKQNALATRKPIAMSRRIWISESLVPKRVLDSGVNRISFSHSFKPLLFTSSSKSKKPGFLNINGILYKSNRRKLEKTALPNYAAKSVISKSTTAQPSYRRLIVRGENFLLDASGKNLIRIQNNAHKMLPDAAEKTLKRIDIGKVTFVKKSNNTYERTDYHKSRYHLNVAKQRSIQLLTNRLVKSNVPCLIYRKLGKCAAYLSGKCAKLHDPKLVDICSRFLKGTCVRNPCLLSHNVTLSKMPTCKFYLLGMCAKTDCPYLHKKVNEKTEICLDFLKGYCDRAEECAKRHDFLCPEYESKGSCKLTRCPYPHRCAATGHHASKTKLKIPSKSNQKTKTSQHNTDSDNTTGIEIDQRASSYPKAPDENSAKRYFVDDSQKSPNVSNKAASAAKQIEKLDLSENRMQNTKQNVPSMDVSDEETIIVVRKPKLGPLPSFIPIG